MKKASVIKKLFAVNFFLLSRCETRRSCEKKTHAEHNELSVWWRNESGGKIIHRKKAKKIILKTLKSFVKFLDKNVESFLKAIKVRS